MFCNRGCCNQNQNAMGFPGGMPANQGCGCQPQPIVEPAINKCVEREFCHEVPHICPIHTHVVNKHIFKHTYTPEYSCSEENQIINLDCGGNQFNQF